MLVVNVFIELLWLYLLFVTYYAKVLQNNHQDYCDSKGMMMAIMVAQFLSCELAILF